MAQEFEPVGSTPFPAATAADVLFQLRCQAPLTHIITNHVVTNFTANLLLAIGATPAMLSDPQESSEFQSLAKALSINVGTLSQSQAVAIRAAVDAALEAGNPWVLDPVAVGPLSLRTRLCEALIQQAPSAIRGNASEIMTLAGFESVGRGPESVALSDDAVEAARSLAQQTDAIVAVTGARDYITDGEQVLRVEGGSALLTRITGAGCALSSLVAACLGTGRAPLEAAASACAFMAAASEIAEERSQGPGSLSVALLDSLYDLNLHDLERLES
ncbi:hydroxyethylthiazole kinase [Terasakiispira papahanaumokuakeensis]|uniref:Hydroxyethylthiazole kinase n=1 Tax=Terasakiispira papahanaumokuakeensis TaxID=197479 RepID=A0A1E2V846_9GAMM|nr:hydroxyethylthiazole kinase [Terasakiispira papahanaumokuakeensis]ODC03188.1 hydroxyethylthiazole kinase [Terasakiispira papahanaumokuakeensis]